MVTDKHRSFLWLLLLLTAVRGILYLVIVPPWQAPDEPTHFEYAQLLARSRNPLLTPRPDPALQKEIIASLDEHQFWRHVGVRRPDPLPETFDQAPFLKLVPTQIGRKPALYYFLASLALRLFPESSVLFKLHLLRSLSLAFTIATVALIYRAADLLLPEDRFFPAIAAAAAAFLPQFMLTGTSVSYDPLANFLGAAFLSELVSLAVRGVSPSGVLIAAGAAGLGALTTYKSLALAPLLPAALILYFFSRPGAPRREKKYLAAGLFLVLGAVVLAASLIWVQPVTCRLLMEKTALFLTDIRGWIFGTGALTVSRYPRFHRELFRSFWLKFGWARYSLPGALYLPLAGASLAALAGVIRLIWRLPRTGKERGSGFSVGVLILLLAVLSTLIGYYGYWGMRTATTTVQGRHLFPALSAWSILFVLGWREIIPARGRNALYLCLLAGFVLLDLISLFGFILPTFQN